MNKEEYYDALTYLLEHSNNCPNCNNVNMECDKCEMSNTLERGIAHYKLANLIEYCSKMEKALEKSCQLVFQYSGSCPLDVFDYDMNCYNECENQYCECWKMYFMTKDDNA